MVEPSKELIAEAAAELGKGLHCSQVTFAYAAKKLGYDEDTAKKIGTLFGGGMFNGERCGALTGGMMGVGLKYGFSGAENYANMAQLSPKKAELEKKFVEVYNSMLCKDIIGVNIGTPEGMAKIQADPGILKNCPVVVATVNAILDEIL